MDLQSLIKNGSVIQGMPEKDYHAVEAFGSTNIKDILTSIRTYLHKKKHPMEQTDAMKLGSAFHTMILEPDLFDQHYIIRPKMDGRTKEAKEFNTKHADKKILPAEEKNRPFGLLLEPMKKGLLSHPKWKEVESLNSFNELSMFWTDSHTGLKLKCRLDTVQDDFSRVWDLKTIASAHPRKVRTQLQTFEYQIQDALYSMIIYELTGVYPQFNFVFCEKENSNDVLFVDLEAPYRNAGRSLVALALDAYAKWEKSPLKKKPSLERYSTETLTVKKPQYL